MSRRELEHTTLGMPNGWFAVAWSRDVSQGEVKPIRSFGHDLVLFRTREGKAAVLDAYCPHLGAHIGHGGRVMGETVRCPFHGWQFDTSGQCAAIPYCERIPPKARLRSWDVVERNQMIFAWHHAEQKPPSWDVPELPEFHDPAWTEPRRFDLEVPVHSQEMAENNCDPVHFAFVHNAVEPPKDSAMSYGEGGRYFRITSSAEHALPGGQTVTLNLDRETWGMGLTTVRMKGMPGAGLLMFSSTTPVDPSYTHSRWAFTVTENMADVAGEEFIANMQAGVTQDFEIWKNKVHRKEPVFCEADKHLVEFRKWARQFYSDPQAVSKSGGRS